MPFLQNEHARSRPSPDLHAAHLVAFGTVRAVVDSGSTSLSDFVMSSTPSPKGEGTSEATPRSCR
eukprot:7136888-Prymnesium_polylepis.1